jgi:transmembrane sensor
MEPINVEQLIINHLEEPENGPALLALNAWLEKDPRNRTYFDQYRQIWEQSPEAAVFTEIDAPAATARFKARLPQTKVFPLRWVKIAAAAAVVTAVTGTWYWMANRPSTQYLAKTTTITIDSVVLEDGTRIVLNKHSQIKYSHRKVQLEYGEAFFDVVADPSETFVAYTGGAEVKVLGTSFNLAILQENVKLFVVTGAVNFGTTGSGSPKLITAGKGATYVTGDTAVQLKDRTDYNEVSWRTGELRFIDTPMDEVCEILSEHYQVKVIMDNKGRAQLNLNANFSKRTLDEVLQTLSALYDYHYEKRGDTIFIR